MKRKILLSIIEILIIICTIFLSYEKINKPKEVNDNGMFAIYLEEEKDSGKYQKSNLKTWPTEEEYTINMLKSYCENGSTLRWNKETKKISLKVTGTDKCYVYFDKAEVGSAKHPHLIQTIEDLVRLSNDVNDGKTYAGEYFLLTNDLDFNDPSDYEDANRVDFKDINGNNQDETLIKELTTGSGFVPIGNSETDSFQGTFDGGNKRIDNIIIHNEINDNARLGIFGVAKNAIIKNLIISGDVESTVTSDIGAIIGTSFGTNKIINCHNKVNITSQLGAWSVGGIIGANHGITTIENSSNKGNVQNGGSNGGIIGYNNGTLSIKNTVNYGNVTNNLGINVGGILGNDSSSSSETTIINSHNEGTIIQNINNYNTRAGGLVAQINGKAVIENSYNVGKIKSDISLYQANSQNMYGGIVGRKENTGYVLINKSYNQGDIEVIGNSYTSVYIGGLIGDLYGDNKNGTAAYIINSYNLGNFTNASGRSSRKSGIIGEIYLSASSWIINSYNQGNIIGSDTGFGILLDNSNDAVNNMYLNNVFNLGNLNCVANFQIYRPISADPSQQAKLDYQNTYYIEGLIATNRNDITFTAKPKEVMTSQSFVDELNQNVESINLEEIDSSLKDYTLSKWQLGKNGYPELINE